MTTELLLKPRELRLEDLPFLTNYGSISDGMIHLDRSAKQYRLKTAVSIELRKILNLQHADLVLYVLSLSSTKPRLIPFILDNQSVIELANYLLRVRSQSVMSLYAYSNAVWQYSNRLDRSPDEIIADVKRQDGLPNPQRIEEHRRSLKAYLVESQAQKLSPGYVHGIMKRLRTWYASNAIDLPKIALQKPTAIYKDNAPSQEQVLRLLDYATLREKVCVTLLCLSGMREGTLVRLMFRHIKDDFEKGISPIHVHIDLEITKGKYAEYDTFIGGEAEDFLRKYFEARKKGGVLHPDIGPEDIADDSPLIRDELNDHVRGSLRPKSQHIGEKQLYKLVHSLISKAGLLRQIKPGQLHYTLKPHTLRKFYKTQMIALGVPSDYVDYMMGHVIDTYHDVQSKGVEFLRDVYARARLTIRPKSTDSRLERAEEFMRFIGMDPKKTLIREAFAEPHRMVAITAENRDDRYTRILLETLKQRLEEELAKS